MSSRNKFSFFFYSTAFHISCLRFLNRFVETSRDTREKILIQTELEEAGFDLLPLKKMLLPQTSASIKDRNEMLQVRNHVFTVLEFQALKSYKIEMAFQDRIM